ncbi:S8 family serine peptidase [Ideonella sp. 4Y11]|uniref:S8 family serine peptidase n=1 Tax=Ideonella aquatica TaxID=2824119 RepID=A0A941BMV2_9BURK|nr:S8 family peptidase [Ideonella aquatica]MBQ0961259.1 S8 family serine peptidase [Ideonella aquatica]
MAMIKGRTFLLAGLLALSTVAGAAEQGPLRATATAAARSEQARVIVRYREDSSVVRAAAARGQDQAQHAGTLGARVGLSLRDGRAMGQRQQLVQASGLSSQALAKRLAQDAQVEWAVPDRRRRASFVPNDPFFASGQSSPMPPAGQWWLRPFDATLVSATRSTVAWDTTRGSGVVVAVLDTGVRSEHPDLAGRFLPGYNMISPDSGGCLTGNGSCRNADATDPGDWVSQTDVNNHPSLFDSSCLGDSSWHGTQVSGIVGAGTNNALGVAGVAGSAQILPVRVLGKCGGYDSDIIDGMRWAAGLTVTGAPVNPNPAQVINLSLGGSGACGSAYQRAINEVLALGVTVVVAAGNEGDAVGAPANCTGVVAVGGLRHVGTKVGYSSLGPQVAISAPAGNCVNESGACLYPIVTTANDGATTPGSSIYTDAFNYSVGTSFSAPIVAGTAALMKSANASLTGTRIRTLLRATARPFPTTGGDASSGVCHAPNGIPQDSECYCTTSTCGAGMLDSAAAVAAALSDVAASISASPSTAVAGARVTLSSSGSSVGSGRSIASYAWSITGGASLASFVSATNAASATLDTSGAGTVTVRLTITDDLGHSGSNTLALTVSESGLQAAISATPSAPEVGDSVALSAAGSTVDSGRSIAAYQWEIVDGGTRAAFSGSTTGASATLTTSAAGTVTLRLTITDSQGLSSSVQQTLSITAPPAASSGGGGGSTWLFGLGLGLAGLGLRRRR